MSRPPLSHRVNDWDYAMLAGLGTGLVIGSVGVSQQPVWLWVALGLISIAASFVGIHFKVKHRQQVREGAK
ncbi:hypothetical protein NDI85_19940 [Halomicroarcula sp. S1AR25-4]|uniref:hypothetical protein n=1 Tax=Haloarcula sp. S1AR25-4 TaxID=2950538 RepID=UPI0028745EBA|nr:hypothetical protein [Halomicroarcula sp. S1AR25-4]MDS0280060.1 hypothetical protein [Halomicroarcula sp. S1AR25-4]